MRQTFLAILTDNEGKLISFERFGYKRIKTVESSIRRLWENSLYRTCCKGATKAEIYRTEYSTKGLTPELIMTL